MEKYEERQEAQRLADLEEAQQMLGEQLEQDTLTAEDITDLRLVDSEYMSGTRTKIHDFDCKVKGEANRLQYTLEYHDDGEGFTIHTEKDDIWNRMSTQELERLDVKLGQEVLYYHYHNKTVNADTLDELREIREEIMEEESSYFTAISQRVWTDYDKKEKELSGEVEVSEEKESLEEINGISETIPATNFRITDDELGQGTAKEKFRANIMAIQLLKKCEDENRNATPEEQEILSRYVGWGGLADAFDETKAAWETEYLELKTVLTPEEYAAARASTLNAHYTQPIVIESMYQVLENLGFTKGNILEPSMGVGNFFGMLPENLNQSKLYGVELDSISGRIAKLLYPDANIQIKGFEKTDYPNDFFDVAIGNVPFGAYKVNDRQYDRYNFMIHDYFLAKTIDQLRPGGVAALITTKGTMDKASPEVRKYLAERADLLGAIRLPNTAFKANAGTEVSADILFFQKRESLTKEMPEWINLDSDVNGITVNQYFVQHPEMILGEMKEVSGPYGMETTCAPMEGADLELQLAEAVKHIKGSMAPVVDVETELDEMPESIPAEDVDIARLQKAIKNLVEEQEALRCTFHEDQYANVQESQEIDFTYYDLQILSSKEKDEKLEEIRKDLFERNFNINKGPLICFVATRIDDKKTIVHICHDGLVADGESHQIILKELENLYYGKQNASHCSFSEYTHYIKDMKENPEYSELLNEKVKRLSEFDTKPQLDALKDAKEVMKPNVGVVARIIPEDLYFKICEKGRENAVTPFSILLTAFGKALAKYSDNSKFLLNLPVSYRPMELEGVENLVGLCSNFILFGFDDSRSIGFLEQIEDNQNKLFSSREEGMLLSGTDVLKKVKQTKKEEIIAPVVFTSTVGGLRQGEAKFKKNMTLSYTSQVWLEGLLTEVPEGILFTLSYIKELFDEDVVNGIVDVFITILTMFGNKDKELFEMTDIPLAIRDSEIIKKLNDTTEISSSISFREKLKKNCEIYAEKYAFIDEQSHMTYQELKEFSDKLNFILLKKYSLKHGDKVGLYLPKGVEQAACEVALAYLNIVFLPIDVEFPVKIVEHCVSAIGLRMILTDTKEHMEDIAAVTTTIVTLENEIPSAEIGKEALEENSETMLINTSGTTGMPKTVILTWRGIMNCINATQKLFSITSKDVA